MGSFFLIFFTFIFSAFAQTSMQVEELKEEIATTGVEGLMHGSLAQENKFVFTWSHPQHFFVRFNISLINNIDQNENFLKIQEILKGLNRGDKVWVKGELEVKSDQPHIYLSDLKLIKKFDPGVDTQDGQHQRDHDIAAKLAGKTEVVAKIHAVSDSGKMVMVEYRDSVIPLIVKTPFLPLTENLYRGDVVKLQFKIRQFPGSPIHLELFQHNQLPVVEMLAPIMDENEQTYTKSGRLTFFPKSPTINQDVWAVETIQEVAGEKFYVYYTIVNFEDVGELRRIGEKLKKAWDQFPGSVFQGRNNYISTKIQVTVKGLALVASRNQANIPLRCTADNIEWQVVNN